KCQIFFILGILVPKNKVAKTTLIIRPGNSDQTSSTSSGMIPFTKKESLETISKYANILPKTCGPKIKATNPPIIDDGKKIFCVHFTLTRIHLPISKKTPRKSSVKPICSGDICKTPLCYS